MCNQDVPTLFAHITDRRLGYNSRKATGRVPGFAPAARHLIVGPRQEMKEFADQLQELSDKGFIRPYSSPWGAPRFILSRRKNGSLRLYREEDISKDRPSEHEMDITNSKSCRIGLTNAPAVFMDPHETYKSMKKHLNKILEFVEERGGVCKNFQVEFWLPKYSSSVTMQTNSGFKPEGSEELIVYCDASKKGLGAVCLMQRRKGDFYGITTTIFVSPREGKMSLLDALSRKRTEATETRKQQSEDVGGMLIENAKYPEAMKLKSLNSVRMNPMPNGRKVGLPCYGDLRTVIMYESHKSKYSIHPGSEKMYQDVKAEHQEQRGLLLQPEDTSMKWDNINNRILSQKLPMGSSNKARDTVTIIYDRDPRFASNSGGHFRKLRYKFRYEYAYHPQTDGQSEKRPIKHSKDMLSSLCDLTLRHWFWVKHNAIGLMVGEVQLTGPDIVQETTERIIQVKKDASCSEILQKMLRLFEAKADGV
ncbi:putative reverse transcriptase domain-containing protein [Tanacetum coccineum]